MGEKVDRLRGQRKEMHLLPFDAAHLRIADRVLNEMPVQLGRREIGHVYRLSKAAYAGSATTMCVVHADANGRRPTRASSSASSVPRDSTLEPFRITACR